MLAKCGMQYMMYAQMLYAVGGGCTQTALTVIDVLFCPDVSSQSMVVFLFLFCTCQDCFFTLAWLIVGNNYSNNAEDCDVG